MATTLTLPHSSEQSEKKAIRFLKFNEMFIIKYYIVVLGVQQQWRRVSSINLKNNNNGIGFPSLRRFH
jgi:hypothetical protein